MTIQEQWKACHAGTHPAFVARLPSGFVTLFEQQTLPGYCVLIADPLAGSLNELSEESRARFLADLARLGDAIPKALRVALPHRPFRRMNYAILGNVDPTLHAHAMPRFEDEPDATRTKAYWAFPPSALQAEQAFDPVRHAGLLATLREAIADSSVR